VQINLWQVTVVLDPKEKNQQLNIMANIYTEVEEIYIWMEFSNAP
jgi:hypothetical protein